MLLKLTLVGIAVAAVGAANWMSWSSVQAKPLPPAATPTSSAALPWDAFNAITGDTQAVHFPEPLAQRDGTPVELVGVLFPLPQLVEDGKLLGAVLAPPAKFACCGLSCEARSLSLVFVTPAAPMADPGKRLARITGTLRLHREPSHWAPSEVADARIELLPDP